MCTLDRPIRRAAYRNASNDFSSDWRARLELAIPKRPLGHTEPLQQARRFLRNRRFGNRHMTIL
jgi:hypothetical protein